MTDLAIEAHQLTKIYGTFTAVDHVDLAVTAGTVVSLLGPNGAGKTTIVRMLATLAKPTSGTATVCGYDVVAQPDDVRSVMSLTGQFAALEDNLTCRENLVLMARLRGYGRSAAATVVDRLVDRFDIGEFRDKVVKSVSGSTSPRASSSNPSCSFSTSRRPAWIRAAARWSGPPSGSWWARGSPSCSPRSISTRPTPSPTTSC
jgi:ABC-2 type transport system ATP-binding protein